MCVSLIIDASTRSAGLYYDEEGYDDDYDSDFVYKSKYLYLLNINCNVRIHHYWISEMVNQNVHMN